MVKEMLTLRINQLQQAFDLNKKQLRQQYCDANNPYKVGDNCPGDIIIIIYGRQFT